RMTITPTVRSTNSPSTDCVEQFLEVDGHLWLILDGTISALAEEMSRKLNRGRLRARPVGASRLFQQTANGSNHLVLHQGAGRCFLFRRLNLVMGQPASAGILPKIVAWLCLVIDRVADVVGCLFADRG